MRIRYAHVDSALITHRLVKNENYGGQAVSLHGWKTTPVTPAKYKKEFFNQMRESVRREGFRNPILTYCLPEGLFLSFGCSRLRVAQELGIEIPTIIMDYTGEYYEHTEVQPDNWENFFTDVPKWHEFNSDGFEYHYSLERNRRNSYDEGGFTWTKEDYVDDDFIETEFPWINAPPADYPPRKGKWNGT
jgi:hypothetical protein